MLCTVQVLGYPTTTSNVCTLIILQIHLLNRHFVSIVGFQLVEQAERLIASQEQFWSAYKAWLDCDLNENERRQVYTIFPGVMVHNDHTFAQQSDAIRGSNWARLWCTNAAAHLNAENIHGLNAVWRDFPTTLTQVGLCCNSYSDKGTSTV